MHEAEHTNRDSAWKIYIISGLNIMTVKNDGLNVAECEEIAHSNSVYRCDIRAIALGHYKIDVIVRTCSLQFRNAFQKQISYTRGSGIFYEDSLRQLNGIKSLSWIIILEAWRTKLSYY